MKFPCEYELHLGKVKKRNLFLGNQLSHESCDANHSPRHFGSGVLNMYKWT